jgi:hypothetical protein
MKKAGKANLQVVRAELEKKKAKSMSGLGRGG